MLSREWRCTWSSTDRRCSNCIWVINNVVAYSGETYMCEGSKKRLKGNESKYINVEQWDVITHPRHNFKPPLKLGREWLISSDKDICIQLDESTARRQLKSPRSLSGRSLHLTLVTKWSRSHMTLKIQISRSWPRSNPLSNLRPRVQNDMFAFRFVAIGPFLAEI